MVQHLRDHFDICDNTYQIVFYRAEFRNGYGFSIVVIGDAGPRVSGVYFYGLYFVRVWYITSGISFQQLHLVGIWDALKTDH